MIFTSPAGRLSFFLSLIFILDFMETAINMSEKTQYYLDLEEKYGAHNYHPIPFELNVGKGEPGPLPSCNYRGTYRAGEKFNPYKQGISQ